MEVSFPLQSNDNLTINTTDDSSVLSVSLSRPNNELIYKGTVTREQVVNMLGKIHEILNATNGELKEGDIITIGSVHASAGILADYLNKVGLRANVVDSNALWDVDEAGNEVRFVYVSLEGKKRNKYVNIHIEDAIRIRI